MKMVNLRGGYDYGDWIDRAMRLLRAFVGIYSYASAA
jgi:hypothetical protein